MKNLFNKILLPFLAFSLFACSTVSIPTPAQTPQVQATVTQTQPQATMTPVMTPTIATPTDSELSTATSVAVSAEAHLTNKCLEISQAIPANANLSGEVFLAGQFVVGKGYSGPDSKLDMQTGVLAPIKAPEKMKYGGYLVSPNGEQLAYWKSHLGADGKFVDLSLVIENMNGKILKEIPGDLKTWDTYYWLDNQQIVIGSYGQPTVLNPFTGKTYGIDKWYAQSPGGLHIVPVWDVNGVFDSQLSRLFYLQEDGTMLLWDLNAKKILAKIDPNGKYNPTDRPKWAPDDSQIVFAYSPDLASAEEFFSVSHSGQISQLTRWGSQYPKIVVSNFSWSPDGHNIAFFFTDLSKKDNPEQLAVLNLANLEIRNYCNLSGSTFKADDPVWSPDGKMLLIEREEADRQTFKTVLLDLSKEYAAILAENLIPVGWMKAP